MAKTKTRPVGRTPVKREACSRWLKHQLTGSPSRARTIQEAGAKLGWGWATIRDAKKNLGIRSLRQGDEWWWFDPKTYTPSAPKSPWPLKNREPKKAEQVEVLRQLPETTHLAAAPSQLPQVAAKVTETKHDMESPKRSTYGSIEPDGSFGQAKKAVAAAAPSPSAPPSLRPFREPEMAKPSAPLKPRRFYIWESEAKERREATISAAGFADLYVMRADIRLRQEQLHKKGLLQEEAGLIELLSRVDEALEKKKRAEKME